jgi:fluoride exporter
VTPVIEAGRVGVVVAVGAGGALGTVLRYELALAEPPGAGFPWATFTVNLAGALLLGVILTVLTDSWGPSRYVRPFAAVGFCGGLTTFSTWMVESVLLVRDGSTATAALYVGASLLLGIVAVGVGVFATRGVLHRIEPLAFDPREED